ncbi:hypothetical protein [Bathymodiolus thermophilus thioautotrophic gill symbiont]|uniref:hypothetical protein n=1 Tax=Bathymodiolus thermophilus thioautotrophic gill symbiont TaxID=2360 RepID=UPI001ED8EB1B|nr:hypothetical protein [Bathymodiolus thermophilus thioautotrophic gill symbiont]
MSETDPVCQAKSADTLPMPIPAPLLHFFHTYSDKFYPHSIFLLIQTSAYIRNLHQKPTFHPLEDFLNPALTLLRKSLKKSPMGQKFKSCQSSLFMQKSQKEEK